MAKKLKFDGVVEAVHYTPQGLVDWVRAYERRGDTFSDIVLIPREVLVEKLRQGKRFVTGERVPFLASTFQVHQELRLIKHNGNEIVVTGDHPAEKDSLDGVPVV